MSRNDGLVILAASLATPFTSVHAEPRTDRHGDPLPEGALMRLGTVRFRYGLCGVTIFAPGGQTLASAGCDHTIRLWDAVSGKLIRSCPGHRERVNQLVFSPDGKILASSSEDGTVRLWETATGREVHRLHHAETPDPLAFSSNGRVLATGTMYGVITLFETSSGKELRRIQGPDNDLLLSLTFTPDSKFLAAGYHSGPVRLWDVNTGREVRRFQKGKEQVYRLAFSPDGKMLASQLWNDGVLWETASGKEVRRFKRCDWHTFAFTPDGTALATSHFDASGPSVSIRRVSTGEEITRLAGYRDSRCPLTFSSDGKTIVSYGYDLMVRRWNVVTGKEITDPRRDLSPAYHDLVNFAAFSPDGKTIISTGWEIGEGTIRLWDPITGAERRRFRGQDGFHGTPALSPDGKILASIRHAGSPEKPRSSVRLLDLTTGKDRRIVSLDDRIDRIVFSPDGKTLVTTNRAAVRFWNATSGEESRPPPLTNENGIVKDMIYSPDGKTLALTYQPPGLLMPGFFSGPGIRVFDLTQGKRKEGFEAHSAVESLAFSPDGRWLAAGCAGNTVCLFQTASGRKFQEFPNAGGCVVFSPDGRLLATSRLSNYSSGSDGVLESTICVWELSSGRQRCRFTGHLCAVQTLAFSPDGQMLVSGSGDTTLLVWDMTGVRQGDRLRPLRFSEAELASRWTDLGGTDDRKAHKAIWELAAAGGPALAFLRKHLPLLSRRDSERIAGLIAELDDKRLAVRDKATAELEALGLAALPALIETLQGQPSLEVSRRADPIVDKIEPQDDPRESAATLRIVRAIEVLEHIGSPAARQALQDLAERSHGMRPRAEARSALQRLARKP